MNIKVDYVQGILPGVWRAPTVPGAPCVRTAIPLHTDGATALAARQVFFAGYCPGKEFKTSPKRVSPKDTVIRFYCNDSDGN